MARPSEEAGWAGRPATRRDSACALPRNNKLPRSRKKRRRLDRATTRVEWKKASPYTIDVEKFRLYSAQAVGTVFSASKRKWREIANIEGGIDGSAGAVIGTLEGDIKPIRYAVTRERYLAGRR